MANEAGNEQGQGATPDSGSGQQPAKDSSQQQQQPNLQQSTGTGSTSGAQEFKYKEDRSNWVPSHRIAEETRKRQEAEQRYQQTQARLDQEIRRVQALAGVNPVDSNEAEVEKVRAALTAMFPGLEKLTDQQFLDRLNSVAERDQDMQQAVENHWTSHGRAMLDALEEEVANTLGGDLSDRQKRRLADAYINEIKDDPEKIARHERGDRTLLSAFAKDFLDDWYKPAQRQVTNQQVNRVVNRRTPNGRDSRAVTQGKPKIDFNDSKAVEDAMVSSYLDHGGSFGDKR
jgi:hypothetical protein